MWIVFRKSDNQVVGTSADSEADPSREEALQAVVSGLGEPDGMNAYEAFQVRERGALFGLAQAIALGRAFVRPGEGGELSVIDETPETSSLVVTTDAAETHPVDGVPLIPGDGKSFVTLRVSKVDSQGKPQARRRDADLLWLRTDNGTLRDDKGEKEIRSVKLAAGKAVFRLYSSKSKRLATVHLFNADPFLRDAAVRVEFT